MRPSKTPQPQPSAWHPLRMLNILLLLWLLCLLLVPANPIIATERQLPPHAGNPVIDGWYADPDAHIFDGEYWIYPTTSDDFDRQQSFEAFSSNDLITWRRRGTILSFADVPWSTNRAAWAPSVGYKDGLYYLYFSAGDGIGIGVAVSDAPGGPFRDPLGRALISEWIFGAQPIDPAIFTDDDGRSYLYYGGRSHCVVVEMNDDMTGFGGEPREITPPDYLEGPYMLKRGGVYYLMYSVGSWDDDSYSVQYVKGDSPLGPFSTDARKILSGRPEIGTSAGHHSVLRIGDEYYIVYHRRFPEDNYVHHRVTCIDRMYFTPEGEIEVVDITVEGVEARPMRSWSALGSALGMVGID